MLLNSIVPSSSMSCRLPPIATFDIRSECPDHWRNLQPLHIPKAYAGLDLLCVATAVVTSSPERPSVLHVPPLKKASPAPTSPSIRPHLPPHDSTKAPLATKVYKKRGRKPTPGTEEDRKQVRLLKNRRTAEMSRQRRMQYLQELQSECAGVKSKCAKLAAENVSLRAELAQYKRKLHELTSYSGVALSDISGQNHATKDMGSEREMIGDE